MASEVMLTKYEVAEIVSTRAALLDEGAKPMIDLFDRTEGWSSIDIAMVELEQRKIDAYVRRVRPDGSVTTVSVARALLPLDF